MRRAAHRAPHLRKGNTSDNTSRVETITRFETWDWLFRLLAPVKAYLAKHLRWLSEPAHTVSGTSQTEASATAAEDARLPILGGFPYLYSVLSRGVLDLMILPETMTEGELIDFARSQLTITQRQGCLVLGPDRAVYFEPDGSASFVPQLPRCLLIEFGVFRSPFEFEITEDFARRSALGRAYVTMLREKYGHGWGDTNRAGYEISPEEAQALRGKNADGSPRGLTRCATCGEHRGRCLDPLRSDDSFALPVYCRCDNVNRCARCGQLLHERRLDGNYYRPQEGLLIYVPGIAAGKHQCPTHISHFPFVGISERSELLN